MTENGAKPRECGYIYLGLEFLSLLIIDPYYSSFSKARDKVNNQSTIQGCSSQNVNSPASMSFLESLYGWGGVAGISLALQLFHWMLWDGFL